MTDKENSNRGGARAGAGRKKGSSVYGESTRAIRVPESMLPELKVMLGQRKQAPAKQHGNVLDNSTVALPAQRLNQLNIPLFNGKVSAGFPSPADDYIEKTLDLNELLIQKPAATFFVRAEGGVYAGCRNSSQ